MIPAGPIFHKPKSFITAKNILYASICVGVLAVIVRVYTSGIKNNGGIVGLLIDGILYVVLIILIKQMAFCKNWARIILTVWCSIAVIGYVINFISGKIPNVMEVALALLQCALKILALIFLYRNECNIWFNSSKDAIAHK